jgi:hypothetical protein
MATQTCQISATPGFTSVTMRARTLRGVVVQSVAVAAASADDPSLYEGVFTDLPADRYRFTLDNNDGPIASTIYPVTLTTAVFSADDETLAIRTNTETLLERVTTTLFTGITSLASWLGVLAGKTADTTTRAEINATAAGANFNETTDSLEALRDRGDAAWTTGAGGGSGSTTISPEDIDAIVEGVTSVAPRIKDGLQGQYRLIQGDTWSQVFSIASAGADRVVISVKRQASDTDSESVLLVDSETGILVLNGANSGFTAGDGSVAFDSSTVTLTVESNVTIDIPPDTYFVTVKKLDVGSDRTYELRGRLSVPAAGITATS